VCVEICRLWKRWFSSRWGQGKGVWRPHRTGNSKKESTATGSGQGSLPGRAELGVPAPRCCHNPEKYTDGDTQRPVCIRTQGLYHEEVLGQVPPLRPPLRRVFARKGRCPMTRPARYHHHFVHLGEERKSVEPLIELTGCNMRCKFCQKATSSL